jgi:hypothetical protein
MEDYEALELLKEARHRFGARFERELVDPAFAEQAAFVRDSATFVGAQCTRRAGKSNGIGYRLYRKAKKYPGAMLPYIALTRESAKNIMWPVFREINEKHRLGAVLTESNLTVTLPNEARIVCFGADMKNFIQRLRGIKTPEAAVDEGQSFGSHLSELIDDILTPAISDYEDGALTLTGTPGPIPRGYFYDACLGKQGYSLHKWSVYQNPYMPRAKAFVRELMKKKGWDKLNPTYLREWCNEWVLDLDALLLPYVAEKNDYDELPPGHYYYILGVDIGLRDADALAVLAWNEKSPNVYLVEERVTAGQDLTALEQQIQDILSRYEISRIVMDTGGLGAKIAEEFTLRKGIPVEAADKRRKFENAALLKDTLRAGRFKAKKNSRFARDCELVQIDYDYTTPDRLVLKPGFHSDIIDSVLYAFKEAMAFTYRAPASKIAVGSEAWAREEIRRMEEAAIEEIEGNESQPWWAK